MTDGALLFARYAYPPNALGYCGGDDPAGLFEQAVAGVSDRGLRQALRTFDGAWPYLEVIAGANGIDDPLDARVVEAYWVGNALLDRVGRSLFGGSLEDRFRGRAGASWSRLAQAVPEGALPHHAFHVLGVYPFVGLLRSGVVDEPLHVLDRCRIRWGQVVEVFDVRVLVRSRALQWDGRRVFLGAQRDEVAVTGGGSGRLGPPVAAGDWCALHWDWVCDRLDRRRLAALRHYTATQLAAVNDAPARVLA